MLAWTLVAMLFPARELTRILEEIDADERTAVAVVEQLAKQARQTDYLNAGSIEQLACAIEAAATTPSLTLEHRVRLERLAGDVREDALAAEADLVDLMGS